MGQGREERSQHSITVVGAVTSPNYFPAPGFISNPGINSDCCIYSHLSQIRHHDTDEGNVVVFSYENHCRVKVAAKNQQCLV